MTTQQRVVSIDRFLGLNLKADPMELRITKRGYDLVKAQNVDITDLFKLRRRTGYAAWRLGNIRKIWSNGVHFLAVEGNELTTADGVTSYRSDLHPTNVPCFTEVDNEVYYSDGKVLGKFDSDGNHTDWAVEEPAGQPTLSVTSGALYPGCYIVAVTYEHDDGRESGTGEGVSIDLPNGGGIRLTSIPQPVTATIAKINVYCTEANGTSLQKAASLPPATGSYNINSRLLGRKLMTQFLSPPPPSTAIAYAGSRIAVAFGEYLVVSEPFTYHLFNYGERFFTFPQPINLLAPTEKALFVSAGAVYFVPIADPSPQRKRVSKEPAITGTNFTLDSSEIGDETSEEKLAGWVSEEGIMVGTDEGSLKNLTEGKIDIGSSTKGAAIARKSRGLTQVVASVRQPSGQNVYMGDVAIATVKRHGILEDFNLVDHDGEPVVDHEAEPVVFAE
jgi:hypothetical protein